jgi:hypothetical protein
VQWRPRRGSDHSRPAALSNLYKKNQHAAMFVRADVILIIRQPETIWSSAGSERKTIKQPNHSSDSKP